MHGNILCRPPYISGYCCEAANVCKVLPERSKNHAKLEKTRKLLRLLLRNICLLLSIDIVRTQYFGFSRSGCPEVFCKKGVLSNFTKFTEKHLYQSPFSNGLFGLRPVALLKRLWHRCFPCEFGEFSRNAFSHRAPLVAASVFLIFPNFLRLCVDSFDIW